MKQDDKSQVDVAVIGGGLAGMAASIHLADAGLKVLCIEASAADTDPVGESLDWSAPALLKALGLPMESLLDQGIATYKRHVILKLSDGSQQHYTPGEWLGRPPFEIDLRTIHADRMLLNQAVRKIFLAKGVKLLLDKVVHIETVERRVTGLVTATGDRIYARWFLDASGSGARLFPRYFGLPWLEYGPQKVAIWDYFPVAQSIEGTTLHADGANSRYMEWVWQIPIHPQTVSVGYVSPAESVREGRRAGMSVEEIFQTQLEKFSDLRNLVSAKAPGSPRTTSFRCRVFTKITGPNWLVIGEAAAMVDPLTSNGVTAALRHAAEASALIARFHQRHRLPHVPAAMYRLRVQCLAQFFNRAIEKVLYEWPIRHRIGPFRAGELYTIPAWSINVVYSRLRPRGLLSTTLFCSVLAWLGISLNLFYWFCRPGGASPAGPGAGER